MGWQVNIGSGGYIVATQVQGLLILNDPNYVFERWHGTLLIIAVAVCSILFNTFLAKKLPLIEGLILILHVFGFFAVLIPLWIFAPRTPASVVFTQFSDGGNWGSIGLACLVGMTGPVYSLVGPDSAVHMGMPHTHFGFFANPSVAEEIKDSSRVLPLGMMWTILLNGITGFIMVVTFCFCAGDITEILSTPTGFPFIQVFYNATQSYAGATIMTSIIITMALCSTISNVATASRQMFAFARDQGLPFSTFLSHVRQPQGPFLKHTWAHSFL
jgi:choline transport protein